MIDEIAWKRGFFIGFCGMVALVTVPDENHIKFLDRMLPKMKQPPMSLQERDWSEKELRRMLPYIAALRDSQNKES